MTKNDIIGSLVVHNKKNIGKIKSIKQINDSEFLNVQFDDGDKLFPFPDIVSPKYNSHFMFIDRSVQRYVEDLFTKKYSKPLQVIGVEQKNTTNNTALLEDCDVCDEWDKESLQQVVNVLNEIGIDFSTLINVMFKRLIKERSVAFLFDNNSTLPLQNETHKKPLNSIHSRFLPHDVRHYTPQSEITKKDAFELLYRRGYGRYLHNLRQTTFSSKNSTTNVFWANPRFDLLGENWSLILNDTKKRKLHLFYIPAETIEQYDLIPRNDKDDLIDLQIQYDDPDFTDIRSKFIFRDYFVAEIDY